MFASCMMPLHIGVFNERYSNLIVVDEKDTIDIYEEGLDGYKLLEYLQSQPPFCRYCAFKEEQEYFAWEISKEPRMEDWVLTEEKK